MNRLKSTAIYATSFLLGRAALMAAPLVLSNLLMKTEYGRLEWAQASAALASNWATLGTSAVLPLVMIVGETEATVLGIYTHHLIIGLGALLLSGVLWLSGASTGLCLAALFTAAISLQSLWSTELKSEGRAEASIFLQAGLFTLMAVAAMLAVYAFKRSPTFWIGTCAIAYSAVLLLFTIRRVRGRLSAGEPLRYAEAIGAGTPLMISTAFTVMATTSDRFCIGLITSPSVTAEYAVLARGAAAPIVMHQLISIAKFRDLFAVEAGRLDGLISKILLMVAGAGVIFLIAYPLAGWLLGHAFVDAFDHHRAAAICILGSQILWSGIALNDLVFTRNQIMKQVLPWTGASLLLAYPLGYAALAWWGVSLSHFAILYVGLMAAYFLCQCGVMFRRGIRHPRSLAVVAASVSAFLVYAWFQ